MLGLNPECMTTGPIWEDLILLNSEFRREFSVTLYDRWAHEWGIEANLGGPQLLLGDLGTGIDFFEQTTG
jgi:hypothetical protein